MNRADDPISPNHYARFKIQPITFIMENGLGFCAGNVIKYVCRHDAKNGVEDLKKARNYLDKMIAQKEQEAAQVAARNMGVFPLPPGFPPRADHR